MEAEAKLKAIAALCGVVPETTTESSARCHSPYGCLYPWYVVLTYPVEKGHFLLDKYGNIKKLTTRAPTKSMIEDDDVIVVWDDWAVDHVSGLSEVIDGLMAKCEDILAKHKD